MAENNNFQTKEKILKKGSEINFVQKIYRYYGFILPIVYIVLVSVIIYSGVNYYLMYTKNAQVKSLNNAYTETIKKNDGIISLISNYSKILDKYDEYTKTAVNFQLLFNTIERYIPRDMDRSSMKFKKSNGSDINVIVAGKITSYDSYISLLSVLDKCNFVDPKVKKDLLALNKIDIGEDGQKLGDTRSISINFLFNTDKNKVLNDEYYKNAIKRYNQYGNYLYLYDITAGNKQDLWSENGIDYAGTMKTIIDEKNAFTKRITEIANIDENGFHLSGKAGNFITEYKNETAIATELIKYLEESKVKVTALKTTVFDDGIVSYQQKKEGNSREIIKIKKVLDERIVELNKNIAYLTIINRYNAYLLNNHQLETFTYIKSKDTKDADKSIANVISTNNILTEKDPLLDTIITDVKDEKDREDKRKQVYVDLFNFIKDIDNQKDTYLNVKVKYIDNFYADYYKNKGLSIFNVLLKGFIDNGYDEALFTKLTYKGFNFTSTNLNANFSYKKRFYLTIKNDVNLKKYITFLTSEKEFAKAMNEYDDFNRQETDLVSYNNSKIDCMARDIKYETEALYKDILDDKGNQVEETKKTEELNIIINTLK